MNNFIVKNFVGYFQNRNLSQTIFVGTMLISENYETLSLVESRFNKNTEL